MDSTSSTSKRKPGGTYVCKRCNVPGHWIAQCPTSLDPSFDTVPPRFRCPLCGAVGKHLVSLCPKNTDPKSINQQRILAVVATKDHRQEGRRGRHRSRLPSNKSSSKEEDGTPRRRDGGRSRGRGLDRNLDHAQERSRSRSPRIGWKTNYGPMNADRARMMRSGARGNSRDSQRRRSSTQPANAGTSSKYAVRTSEYGDSRRSTTTPPPNPHPPNNRCDSLESSDRQADGLNMNMALRSRRPQEPDETAINTDRILESVEQYITAQFGREGSESKSPGPQDAPIVEPTTGTKHLLDSYSAAAARSFALRCGPKNLQVNHTKRSSALDLWDKKEQALGSSRAPRNRPQCI
ncbi:hypothetical protein PpBr36_01278 [Pyricularia pennisetigena]|uniref:hypothetical protein n=1 Tax=Pyricularia pennisetigena TaxID=1578925 RepID=UPI001151E799|nr:hypothetical protein PpBr36_01278 [Pyricularia pennisetigena]TLS28703.1 hypothetical protein PpBr36_01278 [Pyricularia pennisetigena]